MSFMITVAKPLSRDFQDNVRCMKEELDMIYVPERKCWVGEVCAEAYEDVMRVCGEFVLDMDECPIQSLPKDDLLRRIDMCADLEGW